MMHNIVMLLNIPPLLHAIVRYYYCYSLLLLIIIDIGGGEEIPGEFACLFVHSLNSEGKGSEGNGNLSSHLSDSRMPA